MTLTTNSTTVPLGVAIDSELVILLSLSALCLIVLVVQWRRKHGRPRCAHDWELITQNGRLSQHLVSVSTDPLSSAGMMMPVCCMRVCQKCLRQQVSPIVDDAPCGVWRDVESILDEDRFFSFEHPSFPEPVHTMVPKGTIVVADGWF